MRVSSNPLYSILGVALLVSACATQPELPERVADDPHEYSCYPVVDDRIFFDLDSAELRVDAIDAIKRVVDFLSAYPVDELLLEGHADSRGSEDYNLTLGSRRAEAAQEAMIALGFPAERSRIVSYGEYRPAVFGEGHDAWAQNRRVVFVFGNYLEKIPEIYCGDG